MMTVCGVNRARSEHHHLTTASNITNLPIPMFVMRSGISQAPEGRRISPRIDGAGEPANRRRPATEPGQLQEDPRAGLCAVPRS